MYFQDWVDSWSLCKSFFSLYNFLYVCLSIKVICTHFYPHILKTQSPILTCAGSNILSACFIYFFLSIKFLDKPEVNEDSIDPTPSASVSTSVIGEKGEFFFKLNPSFSFTWDEVHFNLNVSHPGKVSNWTNSPRLSKAKLIKL